MLLATAPDMPAVTPRTRSSIALPIDSPSGAPSPVAEAFAVPADACRGAGPPNWRMHAS